MGLKAWKFLMFSCLLFSFLDSSSSTKPRTCMSQTFSNGRQFAKCIDLPVLNSYLHWTYDLSAGTVEMAYRRTKSTSSQWSAWGINPSGPKMVGTQALVAVVNPNGVAEAFTTSIDSMNPSLKRMQLNFPVSGLSATFEKNEITIFGVLKIPPSLLATSHVWQQGRMVDGQMQPHPTFGPNVQSTGGINFKTGL
ncbi:Acyl-CoA N-acyltransferases superfamily protein isoform 1 [Hibiscus syriacus]|uniref:Acyl-CoA N-acyltransferases superfamily protein isoform 1 n=1 Tax=Hibiscus syriacus TaxID=106335 RepID=A0A6A3BA70_HIBSY|nr:cytochrome b561 and DOMON domain-containing protein At5g35735-like [Hibiscus syriacus]KAE8712887.1 Acyl-CoA N-acyltransferases superfamily protein isoform 1 [Hibiscus syriacus]